MNNDGYNGMIYFRPGGTLQGFNDFNTKYWTFDGLFLYVLNQKKVVTLKYTNSFRDYYGKWRLDGRFIPSSGWFHYLIQV